MCIVAPCVVGSLSMRAVTGGYERTKTILGRPAMGDMVNMWRPGTKGVVSETANISPIPSVLWETPSHTLHGRDVLTASSPQPIPTLDRHDRECRSTPERECLFE